MTFRPNDSKYQAIKTEIQTKHGVVPTENFDVEKAIVDRIKYLKEFLRNSGRKAFILGISGGVDSTTTGKLCQIACKELSEEGYPAKFVAVRLPAGTQNDEEDAQAALKFIQPDCYMTVNIGEAANLLNSAGVEAFEDLDTHLTASEYDYHKGNIKARLRMTVQYHLSALHQGVVVGTDHNSEFVMAFYTRFGDEACDVTVLNGLNKRQVRLLAKELGAPEQLWNKAPTADLEELNPGKLDDEGFGFSYHYLDDFLEGKPIPVDIEEKIIIHFDKTRFKREPIHGFK